MFNRAHIFICLCLIVLAVPLKAEDLQKKYLTEKQINVEKIFDKLKSIYSAEVQKKGFTLSFIPKWEGDDFNAYVELTKTEVNIHFYGGLLISKQMNEDSILLTACHELGHILGGSPKLLIFGFGESIKTNEGQSDYWATLKCMRRYLQDEDNESYLKNLEIPKTINEKCNEQFKNNLEANICKRSALASFNLTNLFAQLTDEKKVSPDTPDLSKINYLKHDHSSSQCRFDTLFQGSLCDVDFNIPVSEKNPHDGACTQKQGDLIGVRPTCWYKE